MAKLSNKEIQTIIKDMEWCDECLHKLDQFFNGEIDFDDIDIQEIHNQGIKMSLYIIENTIESSIKKLHKCYIIDSNDINGMYEWYANLLGELTYQSVIYCFWSSDNIPEQLLCNFKDLIIQQYKYQYGLTERIFNNGIDVASLCTVLGRLEDTWSEYYKDGELCSNEEMYKIIERQMSRKCAEEMEDVEF